MFISGEHMKYLKLLLIAVLVMGFSTTSFSKKIKFKEKTVMDEDTGTTITTDENKSIMAISSLKYHFVIILPYYNNWEVEVDGKQYILFAHHERMNVSLDIFQNKHKKKSKYLKEFKKRLLKNKKKLGIEELKIIKHRKDSILVTVVDVYTLTNNEDFKGIKQINYFSTKSYRDERFSLHISIIQTDPKIELNNKEILDFITVGFNIDFERN